MYIELHTASAFSFLDGASLPETLIDQAARYGYSAIALLDRDGVYGAPRFHRAAIAAGIRPIIGAELTLSMDSGSRLPHPTHLSHLSHPIHRLPVLIESQEGYQNLCRLVTRMKMRAPKGVGALTMADLDGATTGLVALAGRELLWSTRYGVGGLIDPLFGIFGRSNVYVELQRHLVREEDGELRPKKDKYSNLCDALQYGCISLGEGRRMVGLAPIADLKPVQVWNRRKTMRRVSA